MWQLNAVLGGLSAKDPQAGRRPFARADSESTESGVRRVGTEMDTRDRSWQKQMACGRLNRLFHSDNLTHPLTTTFLYLYWLYLGSSTQPLYWLYLFICIRSICF